MSGIIGKKIGMTSVFDDAGNNIPCTVLLAGPNVVTQIKNADGPDGYKAVQVAFEEKKEKRVSSALKGHFKAAGTSPKRIVREFRGDVPEVSLGDELTLDQLFAEGERVDVVGTSKGKGYQGVVRRHGFGGSKRSHGQSATKRAPGSISGASDPSRVFKGKKMAGQMGNERVKVKNLRIARILADQNLLLVQGAVPGHKNGYVEIHKQKQPA